MGCRPAVRRHRLPAHAGYHRDSSCTGVAPAFLVGHSPSLAGDGLPPPPPPHLYPHFHLSSTSPPSHLPSLACSAPTTTRTTCCTSDRCGCSPRPSSAACSVTALRRRRCVLPAQPRPRPVRPAHRATSLSLPQSTKKSLPVGAFPLPAYDRSRGWSSRDSARFPPQLPDGVHAVKRDAFACGEDDPGPMVPGRAWMAIALTVGVVWTLATHVGWTLCALIPADSALADYHADPASVWARVGLGFCPEAGTGELASGEHVAAATLITQAILCLCSPAARGCTSSQLGRRAAAARRARHRHRAQRATH